MTTDGARQVKFRSGRTGLRISLVFWISLIHFLYVDFSGGISSFCSVWTYLLKGLNWFYYILSKASDLRCQQVIFSKSQVKSQVMDSKSKSSPRSMREVASQVTSHKNGDSSRTRVQVTWLESTSLWINDRHIWRTHTHSWYPLRYLK